MKEPGISICFVMLCVFIVSLVSITPRASAYISSTPMIDASIVGNREVYPGQTIPIQVIVQNGGYIESMTGFRTSPPVPVMPMPGGQPGIDPNSGNSTSLNNSTNNATRDKHVTSTPTAVPPGSEVSVSANASNGSSYARANDVFVSSDTTTAQVQAPGVDLKASTGMADPGQGFDTINNGQYLTPSDAEYVNGYDSGYAGGYGYGGYDGFGGYGGTGISGGIPLGQLPYNDLEWNTATSVPVSATTALGMTCTLSCQDTPIEVISDNHIVYGSLPAGSVTQPMTYFLRVSRDAKPGLYRLPMTVTYKRLADDYDYFAAMGPMSEYHNYVEESKVIYLDIVVREIFDLVVEDVRCENMVPGSEGIITLKVKNIGSITAGESVAYITCPACGPEQDTTNIYVNGQYQPAQPIQIQQSMLVPVQNSQYLGDMGAGDERVAKFKVSISSDAEEGTYPLSAIVSYTDPWGDLKSSNTKTFGVYVEPEMKFSVDPAPVEIKCGRSGIANLTLTNKGTQMARDAIVRMNALDPFTVSYDTAYLGDVAPGESANTKFGIKVRSDAVPNTYYVTLEVKYYDSHDDPHITRIIRKPITVLPPPTIWEMLMENWPALLGLLILLLIGLTYMIWGRMKGRKGKRPFMGRAAGNVPGSPPGGSA